MNVSPAIPYTIIHSTQRRVSGSGGNIHFTAPAPQGSFLRFSAVGEVTIDGQPVTRTQPYTIGPHHMSSYMVPIAAGTRDITVGLSPDEWFGNPLQARDFSIFSRSASAVEVQPTATATRTRTPTPRASTTAPTRTPTATATRTPAPNQTLQTWSSRASVSTRQLKQGSSQAVNVTVTSSTKATALVLVEIRAPDNQRVYYKSFDNVTFAANTPKTVKAAWTAPTDADTGTYTVRVGVFRPGWGQLFHWNNSAATFTVIAK
jgi:hypothetical protein